MSRLHHFVIQTFVLIIYVSQAVATPFDGLYRPAGEEYADWSCQEVDLGQDTGAIGVGFYDFPIPRLIEEQTRCELNRGVFLDWDTIKYRADCTSEGDSYHEDIVLTLTDIGMNIARDDESRQLQSCSPDYAKPESNIWKFYSVVDVGFASTRDAMGNEIAFGCEGIGEDFGILQVGFNDRHIGNEWVEFDVDGRVFKMQMGPNAQYGYIYNALLDCEGCGETFKALWEAAAAGNTLTMTAGGESVVFSLKGSRAVLGEEGCNHTVAE